MIPPADRPNGIRPLRRLLFVVAVWGLAAAIASLADAPTPLRAGLALPFLALGPGLAVSVFLGPMRLGQRLTVAAVFSASTLIAIASLFLFAGFWSGPLVLAATAVLTQLVVVVAVATRLRRPAAPPPQAEINSPPPPPTSPVTTP